MTKKQFVYLEPTNFAAPADFGSAGFAAFAACLRATRFSSPAPSALGGARSRVCGCGTGPRAAQRSVAPRLKYIEILRTHLGDASIYIEIYWNILKYIEIY